ncbi:MAG: Hint domain-containing protein, partial [Acetobacteraceae bacterium]|nr:Hint domain-containing protein [Acetobacteraceae bacterium]
AGTRIATAAGPVAVENLHEGADALLAAGGNARIKWIGHRVVDCTRHPNPTDVWPIRVCRGAFADNAPVRDLMLSPDHSVFIDGVLIPIRYLLNGATIRQEARATVTYWHVELDHHGVILAEGLPCESFLDTGNRGAFTNGGEAVMLHPDFALQVWEREACAKLVVAGAELQAARSFLLDRAAALGHVMTDNADLHLVVNGEILRPEIDGRVYRFALPNNAALVHLMSRHGVPAEMFDVNSDHRRLGVAVSAVHVDDVAQDVADMTGQGWHAAEAGWRWTDGAATIKVAGARGLKVEVMTAARSWQTVAAETKMQLAESA